MSRRLPAFAAALLLALAFASATFLAVRQPLSLGDYLAVWGLKARAIHGSGELSAVFRVDPAGEFCHPQLPPPRAPGLPRPAENHGPDHRLQQDFDTVVCIGLLMFLDCDHALRQLTQLQARVRPGGVAIINVLVEGTTYLDMFDPRHHCLLTTRQLHDRFAGWEIELEEQQDFAAPGQRLKRFVTLIARKPPH
jgi:hypothetical protein